MDVSTALATAGISAVVSTVVSLFAVATITVRQERAKRREAAREELRQVVRPLQDFLARYRFGVRSGVPERELGGGMVADDLADAIRITQAAEPLSPWRRRLVLRRVARIYGKGVVKLIREYPLNSGTSSEQATATWLAAALLEVEIPDHPNRSLLHRTYSTPPTSGTGKSLARELRHLREAR